MAYIGIPGPHTIAWGIVVFRVKKKTTRLNRCDAYVKVPGEPEIPDFSFPDFVPPKRKLKEIIKYVIPEEIDLDAVRVYLLNLKELGLSHRAIARAIFPKLSESGIAGQISMIINMKRRLSKANVERWNSRVRRLLKVKVREKRLEGMKEYQKRVAKAYEEYQLKYSIAYEKYNEKKEKTMKEWKKKISKTIRDFNNWYERYFDFGKDHPLKWQLMECTSYGFDGIIIQKDTGQIYAYQYNSPAVEPRRITERNVGGAGCDEI